MRSQVIVVSHAVPLAESIAKWRDAVRIELAKENGATLVAGHRRAALEWTA